MALYERVYVLPLYESVVIEAADEEQARELFAKLEAKWSYNAHIFDCMGEYMGNNRKYIINDGIEVSDELLDGEWLGEPTLDESDIHFHIGQE